MNKKIIAIALTGAFITPLAMADVTIYGFMSAGVESTTASGTLHGANAPTRTNVTDENSRIGFKGTEDLGNGTSAIWQIESSLRDFAAGGVSSTGKQATFGTRNTFVGLKDTTFGAVYMGYNDTAYKRYTNVGANIMADTTADDGGASDNTGIFNRGDTRLANSIHYDSPVWNGLQAGLSYGADEASTSSTNMQQWDLGVSYNNGPLKVGAGYNHIADDAAALSASSGFKGGNNSSSLRVSGVSTSFYKLGASYMLPTNTMLAAVYENASYGVAAGASNMTQQDVVVAATQAWGKATVKVSYAKLGSLSNAYVGNTGDWGAHQWVLGATYDLSKQTQLLAYATQIHNDQDQSVNFSVNPIESNPTYSTSPAATALTAGNTLKAIGVGLKVSF